MKINLFSSVEENKKFSWPDLFVMMIIFAILFSVLKLGAGMRIPFSIIHHPTVTLDLGYLPYYAGRSLLRMFIAFMASLLFTFVYGRVAAFNKRAEKIMVPAIDILQSVPVLGFLSITVVGFMALFPGSLLGVECASIFAIFTGQVWNMTFSFYHSVSTIPRDLQEAAKISKLGNWARFTKLEVPYSMLGIVWNSMMSFGGGWFFLAASESITVLNQDISLPGIGSYMAAAVDTGNMFAIVYAIITMIIMILVVDQLFWRPIVAWSQKFKNEQTEANEITTSWVYNIIRRAKFSQYILYTCKTYIYNWTVNISSKKNRVKGPNKRVATFIPVMKWLLRIVIAILMIKYAYEGIIEISKLSVMGILKIMWLGFFTACRVFVATILGMIWTFPVGVMIGFHPKLARVAQPIVQIFASFPANMVFPFLTVFYIKYGINMEIGAIPFMMLGTQWYILFNVIAGAMAIPSDLREAGKILRLTRFQTWKRLILPGVFPYLVTGGITASGGAWNASIVSEIVSWKNHTIQASGLGSFITQATTNGNWPEIICGIMVMAIFVVAVNRLFWKKLYMLAEKKYHIE
ncbi:sulfonate ABC transporter permease [Bacillus cereus]|uniref:Sulfonate ABC transporter permease n=1 Tax=Bacillus cereus TaxID=1396 RepID=A0A9X7CKW0_BACCE|nr:ABC transporter permease subunit [Bacillus cereus]PGS77375.1 sulfonate ABC transporter permease [Bacillus cereus]